MGGATDKKQEAAAAAADAALAEATAKAAAEAKAEAADTPPAENDPPAEGDTAPPAEDTPPPEGDPVPDDGAPDPASDEPNLVPLGTARLEFTGRWTFQVGNADGVSEVEYNEGEVVEVSDDVAALAIGHGRARPTKKKVTAR